MVRFVGCFITDETDSIPNVVTNNNNGFSIDTDCKLIYLIHPLRFDPLVATRIELEYRSVFIPQAKRLNAQYVTQIRFLSHLRYFYTEIIHIVKGRSELKLQFNRTYRLHSNKKGMNNILEILDEIFIYSIDWMVATMHMAHKLENACNNKTTGSNSHTHTHTHTSSSLCANNDTQPNI